MESGCEKGHKSAAGITGLCLQSWGVAWVRAGEPMLAGITAVYLCAVVAKHRASPPAPQPSLCLALAHPGPVCGQQ